VVGAKQKVAGISQLNIDRDNKRYVDQRTGSRNVFHLTMIFNVIVLQEARVIAVKSICFPFI
jgi:hypothetical protein